MKIILVLAAIACFIVGGIALASIRSDIQIIAAVAGLGIGFVLIGLVGVMDRLDRIAASKG